MCRDHLSVHRLVVQRIHEEWPKALKEAYITPLLKKPTLDSNDINNCRPISNLSVLTKLLEKAVCKQLVSYLDANNLMPRNQSAYRRNHSTESALTKVCSDIKSAIDNGNLVLLSLLDLSAAFDCVDHEILLNRLSHSFGTQSKVLKWLTSYLTGRTQCVHLSGKISFVETMRYGVPPGSVLGPLLFLLYTAGIFMQTTSNYTSTVDPMIHNLSCIFNIGLWMSSNRLRLNPSKTEIL